MFVFKHRNAGRGGAAVLGVGGPKGINTGRADTNNQVIGKEAIRAGLVDKNALSAIFEKFRITEYQYRKALAAFREGGVISLIGNSFPKLTEPFDLEAERMIYILKTARPWIPATKMVIILQGFGFDIGLSLMRNLYASHGWAQGIKKYDDID